MNKPLVTVIMPTYNRADLIEKSIESVLSQTYGHFEFFILDDGSTDNTKEVVEKYLSDERIKYYYHENQGEAETINWGWSLAKGEYFTQVNSDDTITPDSFEIMVKEMEKHKDKVLAYPDFNFIDENDKITFVTKSPNWDFEDALSHFSCYAASAGTFIRRKAFKGWKTIKRSRFKHINDVEMYWDMALIGDFLHVDKVLANWRVHSGQISTDRYKSIPEIEEWFKYYFSKENLPKNILNLKNKTEESILTYFIQLILNSSLENYEKYNLVLKYQEKLIKNCAHTEDQKNEIISRYKDILLKLNSNFSCLQIGGIDLMGNKFNSYDLHLYLRKKNIDANCFVRIKQSNDLNTFLIDGSYAQSILKSDLFANSDIIHMHLIHNTDFDLTYLPIYSALKPLVITLHDPFFTTGHCVYQFDCKKWKTGCRDCQKLDITFKIPYDTTALNFKIKQDAIQKSNICAIVASDYMENLVKQSPIWKDKKIYKLPFGINQDIFKPFDKQLAKEKLNINKDDLVIMFRAIDNEYKGIKTIKKALNDIKTDKKITIITVDQKGLLEDFKDNYNILEYDWLYDDNELVNLYQATDLFLMPSEQEAFGMMAIEAMSCKVPVISIKGTSLENVTNAPECGICCKKEDFTNELNRIINNQDELEMRAERSYKYAKENYNKDVYIERMIEIYKDIIKNHKIDSEWQDVLNQMKKYNITNYKLANQVQTNIKEIKRISCADNRLWRIFYRLLMRQYLKIRHGKSKVKEYYDKKYL